MSEPRIFKKPDPDPDSFALPEGWIQRAKAHWKEFRPKMYTELETAGQLDQAAETAVILTREALNAKRAAGINLQLAWKAVREEFLFLPSEEDSPCLGENPMGLPQVLWDSITAYGGGSGFQGGYRDDANAGASRRGVVMSGRKVKAGVVLLALVLAICLAVLKILESNRKARLAAEQKAQQEKAAMLDQQRRIAQLASKTNAVTKWREEFSSSGEFLFTADVTRVFVRPDGRPLLFDGAEAQDVAQRGQEFLCYFGVDLSPELLPIRGNTTARLALSCDPSMAKEMMQRGEGEIYAVVARISAVPSYDEVTTKESSGESSTERRFVVSGTELGQEFLGRDYELLKLLQRYSPEDLEKQ